MNLLLKIDKATFKSLKLHLVDPGEAIKNFEYEFYSPDKKKILQSTFDRDGFEWATEDDSNIELDSYYVSVFQDKSV